MADIQGLLGPAATLHSVSRGRRVQTAQDVRAVYRRQDLTDPTLRQALDRALPVRAIAATRSKTCSRG